MTYLDRTDSFIRDLGLDSYRVGGSVRDEILGRKSKDADYMIRNSLVEIETAIRASKEFTSTPGAGLGKLQLRDGTHVGWRVSIRGLGLIEIALPRTEESTGPGRQDFKIVADPNVGMALDSLRRDLTINAIYKNVADGEIVDPTGVGLADLQNKVIRTTHENSFRDDPLRMLRAIRFVSVLGFDPSDNLVGQLVKHHKSIDGLTVKGVSGTAWEELQKILMGNNVDTALRLARDTGVLATFLPELAPMIGFAQESKYHDMTVDEHTFSALFAAASLDFPLRVRVALLFHDSGKPEVAWRGGDGRLHYYAHDDVEGSENHEYASERRADKALRRLNVEKSVLRDVKTLVRLHMVNASGKTKPSKVRRLRADLGDDLLRDLIRHRMADAMGKSTGSISYDDLVSLDRIEKIRAEAQAKGIPASTKDLKDQGLIDGKDIMELGVQGRGISEILDQLLHEVVSQPKLADRDWLLGRAATLAAKRR